MGDLTHLDVAEYNGVSMVVVENEFLEPDAAVVVVPLLPDYPAAGNLNPEICFDGRHLVLATRLIVAVRRACLRRTGSVASQGAVVERAIDTMMAGA